MRRLLNQDNSVERVTLGSSGPPVDILVDFDDVTWVLERVMPAVDNDGIRPVAIYRRQS